MRILSVGNFSGPSWDGSLPDEEHIAGALEDLGHEVNRWQREEMTGYKEAHPQADFTLISQWDGYPEDLWLYLPKPLVYWAFDYQKGGQPWHENLVAHADLYLSKRLRDAIYPNWRWLSQDFAPKFLDRVVATTEKDIDVLFTGSCLPWATERNEALKAVDDKFNLVIHSVNEWPGFKDVRPPVMDHGLPELYARAKVILSIDHTLEAGYWSDRNAQIIACGRRPLFRYTPLSEARFGDRVDYFYSIEDCLKKIEGWQERPTSAEGLYVQDRVKDLLAIVRSVL